jgi:hypothetical protein
MSVYFAESCGYIKIGFAKDPIARASSLTEKGTRPLDVPHGAPVDLIGWVPGGYWQEGAFHARFIDRRVRGEWFDLDPEDVRPLIWEDPQGVDVQRMTAQAVFVMHRHPEFTREQLEAAGVEILAPSHAEQIRRLNAALGGAA